MFVVETIAKIRRAYFIEKKPLGLVLVLFCPDFCDVMRPFFRKPVVIFLSMSNAAALDCRSR